MNVSWKPAKPPLRTAALGKLTQASPKRLLVDLAWTRVSRRRRLDLYKGRGLCNSAGMKRSWVALLLFGVLLGGCRTGVTNLTPSQHLRNENHLYPIESEFVSNDATIMRETVRAQVLVGLEAYEMRRTPLMTNRWETLVPIPDGQQSIHYRVKYTYKRRGIPNPIEDSKLGPVLRLDVADR